MILSKHKNILLLLFGYIVLVLPFIYFFIVKYGDFNYFINLSHDVNLNKYFLSTFEGHYYIGGGYTFGEIKYFFFYGIEYLFKIFFGKQLFAFLAMIMLYIFIGYIGFLKLLLYLRNYFISEKISKKELLILIFIVIIYFSSLAFFQLWGGNFFLISGYYLIPILIYFGISFLKKGGFLRLLLPLFFVILFYPSNFTFVVIFFILLNIFLLSISAIEGFKKNIKKILIINLIYFIYFLPYTLLTLYPLLLNPTDAAAVISSETFYSNRAYLVNIFNQTNFWGLFGSWNGTLRFDYSTFYKKFNFLGYSIILLGIISLIFIGKKNNKKLFYFILFLFIGIVFFIEFSLGYHSEIYNFFYDKFIIFRIFRNVTKLQPGLYFLLFTIIGLFISFLYYKKNRILIPLFLLFLSFFYNLPYFYKTDYIINKNKFVFDIPEYWFKMSKYLDKSFDDNIKILALPKFYSIGNYNMYGTKVGFEGFLEDMIFNKHTYHLNEGFIGNKKIAKSFLDMQYKCNTNIRKKCINFHKLNSFLISNNFQCVLFEYDAVNEYDKLKDFKTSIEQIGYKSNYKIGKLELFCINKNSKIKF